MMESTYKLAQMADDFSKPGPSVHISEMYDRN